MSQPRLTEDTDSQCAPRDGLPQNPYSLVDANDRINELSKGSRKGVEVLPGDFLLRFEGGTESELVAPYGSERPCESLCPSRLSWRQRKRVQASLTMREPWSIRRSLVVMTMMRVRDVGVRMR